MEGRVEDVFRSTVSRGGDQLVALSLQSVEIESQNAQLHGVRVPAPGEMLFVLVNVGAKSRSEKQSVPKVGQSIRGVLQSGRQGVWMAAPGVWYKSLDQQQPNPKQGGENGPRFSRESPTIEFRGMTCEAKLVGGQMGLEVKEVTPATPAQEAGFQPGDLVVAINGKSFGTTAEVRDLANQPVPLKLTAIDINTGRTAMVTVPAPRRATTARPPAIDPDPAPSDDSSQLAASRIAQSLGITVEKGGLRGGVKVTSVDPGSPGKQAGLEVGDVIVSVGSARVSDPEGFVAAIPRTPGAQSLGVRDVRTGRVVPIEVNAAGWGRGSQRANPPAEPTSSAPGRGDSFGIVSELAFYNAEAAVKVVGVAPNSPASRAGIERGMIITKVNGAPALHPNVLAKMEQSAPPKLRLQVVDPATKRETTIELVR